MESVTIRSTRASACIHIHTGKHLEKCVRPFYLLFTTSSKNRSALTWVRQMIFRPFSLSLFHSHTVNSRIPNTYHTCVYVCYHICYAHKHRGRLAFIRCLRMRTFLMKFMKYTHDTSWMHKETRLCVGRWLKKRRTENRAEMRMVSGVAVAF